MERNPPPSNEIETALKLDNLLTINGKAELKKTECLWCASLQETRIEADFTNVVSVKQPCKETFKAKSIATMRTTSVLSL